MAGIPVVLDPMEVLIVLQIAGARRLLAIAEGRRDQVFTPADPWGNEVNSTGAEVAAAKYTGHYWRGCAGVKPRRGQSDVGPYDVRSSSKHTNLIIRPPDRSDRLYVLVTGSLPNFCVWGFMLGFDAKQKIYWADPGGRGAWAFVVPASALQPMTCFQKELDALMADASF
jgi:hypothetical protein